MPILSRLRILAAEKELRDGERVTVRKISEGTGLPVSSIQRYMTPQGVTRFEAATLEKLCKYFECKVGDIIVYSPDDQ